MIVLIEDETHMMNAMEGFDPIDDFLYDPNDEALFNSSEASDPFSINDPIRENGMNSPVSIHHTDGKKV